MDSFLSSRAAFEDFFRQNYQSLCRYVFLYIRDKSVSEDIVQDTFVLLWQKRDKLKISGNPQAYVRSACRNASLNHLSRNIFPLELEHAPEKGDTQAHKILELDEADRMVSDAVGKLPAACRAVYLLVREEGLSYAEVSEQLNISKKTVENQMSKAIAILKKLLLGKAVVLFLTLSEIFKKIF